MQVIPAIDLKGGEVVRAQGGARHLYAPIRTPLSPTSRPADVVGGLLRLYPFLTIYVADLDAIEGRKADTCVRELEIAFPEVTFWADPGIGTSAEAKFWLAAHRGDLVLGSESLREMALLLGAPEILSRSLLSLDFRGDQFQGPPHLAVDQSLWPARLIVMTLARVGSNAGPDLARLEEIRARGTDRHTIYAAGGVRGSDDLRLLRKTGIAGVLVASALHDARIGVGDLEDVAHQ